MVKIGFIGCGNMGGAVASALCSGSGYAVSVYSAGKSAKAFVEKHKNAHLSASLEELVKDNEILVIAVKPQVLPSL